MAKKTRGAMKVIGTAGRTHKMGTGISVDSIEVRINGRGMREIMQSEGAQHAVNSHADGICKAANSMIPPSMSGGEYVVHPRVLRVSAHAFVDPNNYRAMLAQHYHQVLEKAFWQKQGG